MIELSLDTGTADPTFNSPRTIKPRRARRTGPAMADIRGSIREILENDHPQTVRQVFYALTVRGVIAKAEIEYKRTVIRLLVEMREDGKIPFEWIADNARWIRKPSAFTGIEACLNAVATLTVGICGARCRYTSRYGARRTRSPESVGRD